MPIGPERPRGNEWLEVLDLPQWRTAFRAAKQKSLDCVLAEGGQEKCEDSHKPRSGQADAGRREGKKFYAFGRTSELILPASGKDLPSRFLIQQALCLLPMQHFNFSCNQDSSRQYGVWCGMRGRPVRELRVRSNAKQAEDDPWL